MTLRVAAGWNPSRVFEDPACVWAPDSMDAAAAALADAESALKEGYWIAGAFSYEFGAQLAGIPVAFEKPLLVLGAFGAPRTRCPHGSMPRFELTAPLPRVSFAAYQAAVDALLDRICEGEVYQVNYTVPFDLRFAGDPFSLFCFLARRARARYAAFLEHESHVLVSLSPELFLEFRDGRVLTKPMKGTAPPSNPEELGNAKNRAEHVMIVDLLRNDLQRFCSGVTVEALCRTERYPTFLTMTSTIAGQVQSGAGFDAAMRAAFPCGSVTGAPKRAAMQHIAAYERWPRAFYTGSIGYLSPRRKGWWNVAIRTLQIRPEGARFDAGGGIVSDSRAASEWREIELKSAFLRPAHAAFALLETFRTGPGGSDVDAHLRRLLSSAAAFGMTIRREALDEALAPFLTAAQPMLVRLIARAGAVTARAEPYADTTEPVRVCLSSQRVRSDDPFLRHKTSWRPAYEAAALEARRRECFDALLFNERGELTEGSRTNIFVQIGETLYTPPLASGVLPGILRAQLLERKTVVERVMNAEDLQTAQAIFAGNSARGMLRAELTV